MAAFRIMHWSYYLGDLRYLRTEVRADALLVGCSLALLLQYKTVRDWFSARRHAILGVGAATLTVDIYRYQSLIPLHEAVAIALLIGVTVHNPSLWLTRLLETDHLKTTGLMSYSIYMWQNLFLRSNFGILGPILLPLFAAFSWACIERPGIALGRRLMRTRTLSVNLPVAPPLLPEVPGA